MSLLEENVEHGAHVFTDEHVNYPFLAKENDYAHEIINHIEGYVRGHIHTNGIENFWSCLKRCLGGTYISVEPFHLDRYAICPIELFDGPSQDGHFTLYSRRAKNAERTHLPP